MRLRLIWSWRLDLKTLREVKGSIGGLGGVRVPLPIPEDLIVMKAVAHRPQDLADIESILVAHPKLNLRGCGDWCGNLLQPCRCRRF
jgi:hypothetical protein